MRVCVCARACIYIYICVFFLFLCLILKIIIIYIKLRQPCRGTLYICIYLILNYCYNIPVLARGFWLERTLAARLHKVDIN